MVVRDRDERAGGPDAVEAAPPDCRPLVTVAIPTFNRCAQLTRALASARAQDYEPLDIVVLDNASTDGTGDLCQRVAASDERVRYIRHGANRGVAANFNAGLASGRGPYFMWLADDDWIDSNYVSSCMGEFLADPRLVLVAAVTGYYHEGELVMTGEELDVSSASAFKRVLQFYGNLGHNSAFYGVARADALRQATPFREALCDDWLVVARLAALGHLRTIRTTRMHKSMGGVSGDIYGFARSSGLRHWQARLPFVTASFLVAADIRSHPVFSPLRPASRLRLSLGAQGRVLRRIAVDNAVHRSRLGILAMLRAGLGAERLGRVRALYRRRPWRNPADPIADFQA